MLAERGKQDLFEDVQSRHGDLLTLEAALRELHEIYQDIALLIDSQVHKLGSQSAIPTVLRLNAFIFRAKWSIE